MKKKVIFLVSVMLIMTFVSYGITKAMGRSTTIKKDKITIVTSFYPMYIIALNLTSNIDNVEVINLTDNNIGCLHDYQLTTDDMRTLSDGDILILNGGEMEGFLEEVITSYPELAVIDASEHLTFLESAEHIHGDGETHSHEESEEHTHDEEEAHTHEESEAHTHDEEEAHTHEESEAHTHDEEETHTHEESEAHTHDEEETHTHEAGDEHTHEDTTSTVVDGHSHEGHSHSAINGHVWLDMDRYLMQIDHIAHTLENLDPENANAYHSNAETYMKKVSALKDKLDETLALAKGKEIITFHAAFAYLAEELGLEVVYSIDMDSETALSAGDIATVIDEIELHNIKYLFAEEQYSKAIAERVGLETDTNVLLLETMVGGEVDKDSYLLGMERNLEILKEYFGKE